MSENINSTLSDEIKPPTRTSWLSHIYAKLRIIATWQSVVAGVVLVIMMVLDVVDVAGRYFFLHPFPGTYEMVALLLIIGGTWGMANAEFAGGHVRVDILAMRLSSKVQKALDIFSYFILIFILGLMTWQMFGRAGEDFFQGRGFKTSELGIPHGPFYVFFGIGVGIFCLVAILNLIKLFNSLKGAAK